MQFIQSLTSGFTSVADGVGARQVDKTSNTPTSTGPSGAPRPPLILGQDMRAR